MDHHRLKLILCVGVLDGIDVTPRQPGAILVDGQRVAVQEVGRTTPREFYDITHAIPADLVREKSAVTVRFEAQEGSQVARIYGVRIIRADEVMGF